MDSFVKMQGVMGAAIEAEIASAHGGEPAPKVHSSIKSKFKAVGYKISGAFKSLVSKLKSIFQRNKQNESKSEPASELFGFGKSASKPKTRDGHAAMEESVQWVKAHSNEIMSHNDDETFVFGVYNPKTASDDFKNSLGLFIEAKKTIQDEGINFGALIFKAGGDDNVILGFTYDPKNISAVTSVMYIEVGYSVPMSKLMDDDVKAFTLGILGHLLWSINDPDAPVGKTKGIVLVGDVTFNTK